MHCTGVAGEGREEAVVQHPLAGLGWGCGWPAALCRPLDDAPARRRGRRPCCPPLLAPRSPSEGCSKPQSWMARSSSGLSRKSLKPLLWMPT